MSSYGIRDHCIADENFQHGSHHRSALKKDPAISERTVFPDGWASAQRRGYLQNKTFGVIVSRLPPSLAKQAVCRRNEGWGWPPEGSNLTIRKTWKSRRAWGGQKRKASPGRSPKTIRQILTSSSWASAGPNRAEYWSEIESASFLFSNLPRNGSRTTSSIRTNTRSTEADRASAAQRDHLDLLVISRPIIVTRSDLLPA